MSEVATSAPTSVLASFIERAARDPEFDVQKFGELLRMQREVEHDQARKAFNRAMAGCQAEMMPVIRTAQNKHLGNKYAKLEDIDSQMRPIYTRWGFSVRFGSAPAPREGDMRITCTVAHEGGYFEENYLDSPLSALGSQGGRMAITPVQAVGSTVTYLRRYLSTMVFNVVLADDDDDGEGPRRTAPPARSPVARTDAQWQGWLDTKVGPSMAALYHTDELEELARKPTLAEPHSTGPAWVRAEIDRMLAENYERIAKLHAADDAGPRPEATADLAPPGY